ncbi:MAG: hypothetical protein M3N19_06405 [Candidatus Eremiobacteraeota bacterium]|nr:hypothetical protein [Candidatus Eremiobacteraeota bacterium]
MIVTRQRPKQRQVHKVLLPIIAVLMLVAAFVLPPSRNIIMGGPLAPMWRMLGVGMANISKPFHFAAMNNEITARDHTITQLQTQINDDKSQISDRDKQISSLQSQVNQLTQASVNDRAKNVTKVPAPSASSNGFGASSAGGSDLTSSATPDMRRTATQWAAMDAENAAKVVQRLPVPYSARILALMPADAAGQILNALPAPYAAALTQEHPELRR